MKPQAAESPKAKEDQTVHPADSKGNPGSAKVELDFIIRHLPQNGVLIEIGTYHGVSAAYIAERRPDATVISVDPFPDRDKEYDKVRNCIGACDYWMHNRKQNQRLLVGTADDLCRFFREGVADAVFVDGNHLHDFVLADLHAAARLVKGDGKIFVHDVGRENQEQIEQALGEFLAASPEWQRKDKVWTTALLSRR